jgi:hypothetical protein
MKHKLLIIFLLLFITITCFALKSFAQIPQSVNYQGVARDIAGQELPNQAISLKISILNTSPNGAVQMEETHSVTTNQFGLFNISIGNGTPVSGTLAGINWRLGVSKWLKVEMDATGGSNYVLMGTQQLMSVPYSLYANDAGNIQGNPVNPQAPLTNQALIWDGTSWIPADLPTNNSSNQNSNSLIYTVKGF